MTAQRTIARLRNIVAEMNERIADLEYENWALEHDYKLLEIDAKKYYAIREILRDTPGLVIVCGTKEHPLPEARQKER